MDAQQDQAVHGTDGEVRTVALSQVLPVRQLFPFHGDVNLNFQFNRSLIAGEEDLFFELARSVVSVSDWAPAFLAAAVRFEARGARHRAAHMYRAAEFYIPAGDPQRRRVYDKFMSLYYPSEATAGFETHRVPFSGVHLHALRLGAQGERRGTVVMHGGFDSYIEEFLDIARAIALVGHDVILFDGPGQGATLMCEKLTMTPEWHLPVSAVLDHFQSDDVTLIGVSLGGCLALRAAAAEPRVARVVAYDAMLDFFDCVTGANGSTLQRLIKGLLALRLDGVLDSRVRAVMAKDYKARWGIEQGMHVTGTNSPSEFFRSLQGLNTLDVSPAVRQHVLVMAGAEDHFVPAKQFMGQVRILDGARSVASERFTAAENAQSHCQVGNYAAAVTRITQWMDGHRD